VLDLRTPKHEGLYRCGRRTPALTHAVKKSSKAA
jgi:hypothetical protein